MPRPIARITDKSGKTINILVRMKVCPVSEELPAIPLHEFKKLLKAASANQVKALRRKAGASQMELASAMGVSQPMVSKLERHPSLVTQAMLAKVSAAVEAIIETNLNWNANPPKTYDELLAVQAPLLKLAASRKPRAPMERKLLEAAEDRTVHLETEKRTKGPGERAVPPRRNR